MATMNSLRTPKGSIAAGLLATVLLAAALPGPRTAAQQLTGFPQAELPRYTVELIVFAYAEGATTSKEVFVPESPPFDELMTPEGKGPPDGDVPVYSDRDEPDAPVFGDRRQPEGLDRPSSAAQEGPPGESALPGGLPTDESSAVDEPPNEITGIEYNLHDLPLRTRIELTLLAPEQYSMDAIYQELVDLDAYQPIMRAAWTQATPGPNEAPAIRLRALGSPPPGLDGTVKLYQGRFVHLGIDLALDAEGAYAGGGAGNDMRSATDRAIAGSLPDNTDGYGSESRQPIPVYSDRGYSEEIYADDGGFFPQPVRYRIDEVRIMRTGDIRYYDHPRFGVIAKLTEIPKEQR